MEHDPRTERPPGQRVAFYTAVGAELALYAVDDVAVALTKQWAVLAPEAVQYIWQHPAKPLLYVAYSNRAGGKNNHHGVAAYQFDPDTGRLASFGVPVQLGNRPVHVTVEPAGQFLLVAFNSPSNLAVFQLGADGTIAKQVTQRESVDPGVFAHQVRVAPSGRFVVLCARGNDAFGAAPEDPGALKVFRFEDGQLLDGRSVANDGGLGFGPRHVDFHPSASWMYVSMERNNQLLAYGVQPDGITPAPLFAKATAASPERRLPVQYAGPIHVHPNGRFVYLINRSDGTVPFGGEHVHSGGENTVAVFALDPASGEPVLIQSADTRSFHCRTFAIHPGGRMLVAAAVAPLKVQDGDQVRTVPAGLTVFRLEEDGRLAFVRKYDVEVGNASLFWCGMIALQGFVSAPVTGRPSP